MALPIDARDHAHSELQEQCLQHYDIVRVVGTGAVALIFCRLTVFLQV